MLVEAYDVSSGIAEARCNFRRVRTEGLHNLTPGGDHGVNGCGHTAHHNVKEQAGR